MRQTMVGMPFISRVTALAESTIYNYTPGGHMLTICVSNPAHGLIHSVQNEEVVFGLFEIERTLFILAKFGRLPWQASYYNWRINAPVLRPDPWHDLGRLKNGIAVSVCLVNASNGIVEALRSVTLSHEFSRAFLEKVSDQTKRPFDPWRHAEIVDEVLDGFAKGVNMMSDVFCMCTAESGKIHQMHLDSGHRYC